MLLSTNVSSVKIPEIMFVFSHLFEVWMKKYHFVFNLGTSSLDPRNIRFVNIILSMIEESKLQKVYRQMQFILKLYVKLHQFYAFQTFKHVYSQCQHQDLPPRISILPRNLEYCMVVIKFHFPWFSVSFSIPEINMHEIKKDICYIYHKTNAEDRCSHLNK